MELRTERLLLRPFEASDFVWLHPIASDPEVTRYTTWGPNDEDATRAFLAGAVTSPPYLWAVLHDGRGIGSAGIEDGSFGYTLGPSYWGRGYATEIARELVRFALDELGLEQVSATCHPENAASVRVLEKAGLVPDGDVDGRLRFVAGGPAQRPR